VDSNTSPEEVENKWTFYEIPLNEKENKPLYQNKTSLVSNENKPSPSGDTRNNTENTNNRKE